MNPRSTEYLFYRLLSVDVRSKRMLLLLFTPVQCIWLMGIAVAAGR
jgi:hypothetical protein